ncbi:hypothetical protein G6F50_016734 [Rhizopus delemar]|uniref:Uncharacterized protein n=1 Tax=Rhizopus delemar TaxID=936053 RepID=A0A9P6XSM8_9FUNG|nr:hypothetical protein G6F50_016734 [Rhizopus delemar]
MDLLANELTSIIHSCLDDSVGQRNPRGSGNAWFWTDDLQTLFDRREQTRRKWKRAAGVNKCSVLSSPCYLEAVLRNSVFWPAV